MPNAFGQGWRCSRHWRLQGCPPTALPWPKLTYLGPAVTLYWELLGVPGSQLLEVLAAPIIPADDGLGNSPWDEMRFPGLISQAKLGTLRLSVLPKCQASYLSFSCILVLVSGLFPWDMVA